MHALPGAKLTPSLSNEHAVPPDPLSGSRPNVTVPTMACHRSLCKAAWLMEAVHWPACSAWWRSARSKPPQPSRPSCTCSRSTPASLPTCALSKTKQHLGQCCLRLVCCVLHNVICAGQSSDASTCEHTDMCLAPARVAVHQGKLVYRCIPSRNAQRPAEVAFWSAGKTVPVLRPNWSCKQRLTDGGRRVCKLPSH